MFPHLPGDHVYRDIGLFVDVFQLILMAAVTYLLWWLVRRVHQLHSIGRFWLDRWNDTPGIAGLRAIDTQEVIEEAVGDHQVPNASNGHDQSTPVTRECGEGFPRAPFVVGVVRTSLYGLPSGFGFTPSVYRSMSLCKRRAMDKMKVEWTCVQDADS
jgi:hypothetical protein